MPATKKKLLTISNLKKYFPVGKASALKTQLYVRANEDISIDIYEGETLGLVGESGCGKSTFGRVLLQLYPQTAGSTMYYGRTLEELAPKYVGYTLKNARKMVDKYHEAQKKADEAVKKCEEAGDTVTHEQNNAKDELVFAAENALNNAAKILGGFMVCPNIEEPAKLMYDLYESQVKLYKLHEEKNETSMKLEAAKAAGKDESKAADKINQLDAQIAELEKKCADDTVRIEQVKDKYRNLPDFDKYEAMKDDGVDLSRLNYGEIRKLRKDLQIIFQDPYSSLNPRMTVGQIIEEGLVTHNMYRKGAEDTKQYILDFMRKCGLQDYMLHRYPHQFSGGQRQRICIARSLAVQPKFVVCDECVSALDVSIQSQIINLLQELKESQNLTYLFISHDLSVVKYISDRIGVMYLGNIVELADKNDIFRDPRHPYTVALLSSIPTTDPDSASKERIILEGNIPSPIKPPTGCKFHTRCYMATEKCSRIAPKLTEVEPNHFVACHYPECKLGKCGEYLFDIHDPKKDLKEE
ncbi:MAG: ATP-binding cassette domain-containing protein [Lachnospiraceae bacterium]|nr:ATP-binding cassette domain-containing protein [Lachnospiraceae bacterium]